MCALSFGQRVLVADSSQQVAQACYPGSCLFRIGRDQIQGFHVVSMIDREAAGWVQTAFCLTMKDVRLTSFRHFVKRIDGD